MRLVWFIAISLLAASAEPAREAAGLSAYLRASAGSVGMGDWIEFNAEVVLDTTQAPPKARMLNRFSGKCELIFEDSNGNKYRRTPFNGGLPRMPQAGDLVRMRHRQPVALEQFRVYLLSEKGEQIPSGTYSVRFVYSQDARDRREAYRDNAGNYRTRTYAGPYEFWKGEVLSESCVLKVLPVATSEVEVRMPHAMVVDTTTIRIPGHGQAQPPRPQLSVKLNPDSVQVIRVTKRAGYALGQKWNLETLIDKKTVSDYPRGLADLMEIGSIGLLHPDITAQVLASKRTEFILHMEIFESSVQAGHLWQPEGGDYKTLWSGAIHHVFSVSNR